MKAKVFLMLLMIVSASCVQATLGERIAETKIRIATLLCSLKSDNDANTPDSCIPAPVCISDPCSSGSGSSSSGSSSGSGSGDGK